MKTRLFYAEPEAAGSPPPVSAPFDVKALAAGIAEGIRASQPAPAAPPEDYDDPNYWLVQDADPKEQGKQTQAKMEKFVNSKLEKYAKTVVEPLQQRLKSAEAGLHYLDMAKPTDKDFAANQEKIMKLAQDEGIPFKAAKRIFDAEAKAKPVETAAVKPVPPKSAVAPVNSSEPAAVKPRLQRHRVYDIMQEGIRSGEIDFNKKNQ